MKSRWYHVLFDLLGQLVRKLVVGLSLERKSLLFLGMALIVPIGLAFWFVLQVVADPLVRQTTRQAARDYAKSVIAWKHVDKRKVRGPESVPGGGDPRFYFPPDVLTILREHLIDNPDYVRQFLTLDEVSQHTDLGEAKLPASPRERKLLEDLHVSFRENLQRRAESMELAAAQAAANPATGRLDAGRSGEPETVEQFSLPNLESLYREDGPIFQDAPSPQVVAPPEGWYVYYHAINFSESCLSCHHRNPTSTAEDIPFRVVKVMVPYRQTQVASVWTLAFMIAAAMVTVAATLLVVHWVLRRIVLNPLQHLRSVSDEISRGNTNLRANIDTGDEFNELADAFNRMLLHMTDGQQKLRKLNKELDVRVDQLAQANLNLYEANRLKSDFLANMSHELRTPLNSIIGFSDVLRDISSLNDKQRRYASNIQNSGKLLLEMINDILDLAKIEAGKMSITPTSFDLQTLVSSQCDMLRSLVDEKNMDVRIEVDADLPEVFQDQPKLQQILTNLLSNAIKFTPDGGLITVQLGRISDQHFHLTVTDTGVGIPESDFEIIFEKFRQSNAILQGGGLTRQYSGTGLGLSIVKELCKLLGGEIRLTSQLGTGSTFCVILPWQYEPSHTAELAAS